MPIEQVDPPLGALPGIDRAFTTVGFPAGSLLLTYTDGLIERRNASLEAGIGRLLATVQPGTPQVVCNDVLRTMFDGYALADDVALLAMRRRSALPS